MKGIIFDMDGVIIDSETVHAKLDLEILDEIGGHASLDEHRRFAGTRDEEIWSYYLDKFDLTMTMDEILEYKKEKFLDSLDLVPLVPGFMELINRLYDAGYKIGLASSNNRKTIDAVLEKFNLEKYFEYTVSGEEVKFGKPNPEPFLKVADNLNLKTENTIVIEDAEGGVEGAKNANMLCVGYINPNSGRQDLSKADLIVDDLNDLTLEVIDNLFET